MAVRHTLLGLLSWEPMHGYRLRKVAQEYSWMYPMTNASIYPALHGLEGDGFVEHDTEVHNGRARKVYRITHGGRSELRRWLGEAPEFESASRDQMLLKISMLDDTVLPMAYNWLESAACTVREEIASTLNENGADAPGQYGHLTREYGLELLRVRLRFLERVLDESKPAQSLSAS